MSGPSFEEVVAFVKTLIHTCCPITPDTRLEAHLGITGEDGIALIQAAEEHFQLSLASPEHGIRPAFRLGPNEYLFRPAGRALLKMGSLMRRLRNEPNPIIRDLTVGELHQALLRANTDQNNHGNSLT
ncbi:MAG: hypothetical protein AAGF01_17530 [Cyanobacteria bacterium P01_G01_bin.38]